MLLRNLKSERAGEGSVFDRFSRCSSCAATWMVRPLGRVRTAFDESLRWAPELYWASEKNISSPSFKTVCLYVIDGTAYTAHDVTRRHRAGLFPFILLTCGLSSPKVAQTRAWPPFKPSGNVRRPQETRPNVLGAVRARSWAPKRATFHEDAGQNHLW